MAEWSFNSLADADRRTIQMTLNAEKWLLNTFLKKLYYPQSSELMQMTIKGCSINQCE